MKKFFRLRKNKLFAYIILQKKKIKTRNKNYEINNLKKYKKVRQNIIKKKKKQGIKKKIKVK